MTDNNTNKVFDDLIFVVYFIHYLLFRKQFIGANDDFLIHNVPRQN